MDKKFKIKLACFIIPCIFFLTFFFWLANTQRKLNLEALEEAKIAYENKDYREALKRFNYLNGAFGAFDYYNEVLDKVLSENEKYKELYGELT